MSLEEWSAYSDLCLPWVQLDSTWSSSFIIHFKTLKESLSARTEVWIVFLWCRLFVMFSHQILKAQTQLPPLILKVYSYSREHTVSVRQILVTHCCELNPKREIECIKAFHFHAHFQIIFCGTSVLLSDTVMKCCLAVCVQHWRKEMEMNIAQLFPESRLCILI